MYIFAHLLHNYMLIIGATGACVCGYDYVLATCEKVCVCVLSVGVCVLCEVIHDDLIKTR